MVAHDDVILDEIEPLTPRNTNLAVQARIADFIERRKLAAGDQLPAESRLAQALGVSRATLREAMRAMESAGIIEARAGSGWFVREFSLTSTVAKGMAYSFSLDAHNLYDLRQIRLHLEYGFLPEAMEKLTLEDIATLDDTVTEMEHLATAGRIYAEQDHLFHTRLFARVANQLLPKLLEMFWVVSMRSVRASLQREDLETGAHNHRLVLDAIRAGDLALARQRLEASFGGPPPFWSADSVEE